MNILITGGAGFIGTNLSTKLSTLGHNVSILDFKKNIKKYHTKNFKCFSGDISKYKNIKKIKDNFDIIFHLAAQCGVHGSIENPEKDCDWNAKGTLNICRFAKKRNIKKVVYASSVAVYETGIGKTELDIPNPLSYYGVSKLAGEHYVKTLRESNIEYVILRIFNCYGPGQDFSNLTQGIASIFMSQAMNKDIISVTGSLERERDLIHINDVIDAMIISMRDNIKNEIYNVSSSSPVSIEFLINKILKIVGKEKMSIENIGSHSGDHFKVSGDNSKLKKEGWNNNISLEEGLQSCYEFETR